MLLTIQDQSKQTWQVKCDLKKSAWEAAGGTRGPASPRIQILTVVSVVCPTIGPKVIAMECLH